MIGLFTAFLKRLDFVRLAEAQRGRNNREAAAQLHAGLLIAYEIIEIFQILLDELGAALRTHRLEDTRHKFTLNPWRLRSLLLAQADNLDKLDHVMRNHYSAVRLLSPEFEKVYREIFAGKIDLLLDARVLLTEARLPINDDHPFPPSDQAGLTYRTLWFSPDPPAEDRKEIERYLHGYTGEEKVVVDVHISDGEAFFRELDAYFARQNPIALLADLRAVTDEYRLALERRFQISDLLADIGRVARRSNWAPSSRK